VSITGDGISGSIKQWSKAGSVSPSVIERGVDAVKRGMSGCGFVFPVGMLSASTSCTVAV
jgi:hypothetical protein